VTGNNEWCAVTQTSRIIARKWYPVIIDRLLDGSKRFGELKASMNGISSKVLSDSLFKLENDNLVSREVHDTRPVTVNYSLTQMGMDLKRVLEEMREWGDSWLRATASA